MAWLLTTPIEVGDLDTQDYAQVKISKLEMDTVHRYMRIWLEYGNVGEAGEWIPGLKPVGKDVDVMISGQTFLEWVMSATCLEDELVYNAVARNTYTYLATQGIIPPGAVV